jgi:fructose-1-phosphate kinase PfkB-like protein
VANNMVINYLTMLDSSLQNLNQVQVILEHMGKNIDSALAKIVKFIKPASLEMSALDQRMADTALDINFINQILQLNKKSKLQ